jgi:hypothetical protein
MNSMMSVMGLIEMLMTDLLTVCEQFLRQCHWIEWQYSHSSCKFGYKNASLRDLVHVSHITGEPQVNFHISACHEVLTRTSTHTADHVVYTTHYRSLRASRSDSMSVRISPAHSNVYLRVRKSWDVTLPTMHPSHFPTCDRQLAASTLIFHGF